jgi:hypothetical protein
MTRGLAMVALFALAAPVFADGGAVVLRKQAGALTLTVFASPAPLRAGPVDISVLVQSSETLDPVLDAEVRLRFVKNGSEVRAKAIRNQSGNRLLYAATVHLNQPGDWQLSAIVRAGDAGSSPVTAGGTIPLAPEQPKLAEYSEYIACPFSLLMILALHQWLRLRSTPTARALRF